MVAREREALWRARAGSAFFWFWRTPKVATSEALLQSKETILQQARIATYYTQDSLQKYTLKKAVSREKEQDVELEFRLKSFIGEKEWDLPGCARFHKQATVHIKLLES